ncbi:MAG: ATP-binding cassette domain-containing protein [Gammaproteobacteria bacterium]|nr:ATP-binding cassette domain-containing protein [Gammaproteobacteria bacterium]
MMEFKQVSKRYPGGHQALSYVDFALEQGEMAFLTGRSGAGKSTLLKLAAFLERPSTGDILIHGKSLRSFKQNDVAAHRARFGLTFQSPHLLYDRSVFENVSLPLQIEGLSRPQMLKRVQGALDKVGLLSKEKMLPVHLSGGEQQRVGIARAIVHKPDWLLADEPTGNLDPALSIDIMALFEQFNQAGVGVLIATHELSLIAQMKHRILWLKEGKLC